MDIEELLAPVPGDEAAGPDLNDDLRFTTLRDTFDLASRGGRGAEDIDWRGAIATIVELARESRDITLPAYLAQAGARSGDLDTVAAGCALLAGLVERYWHEMHPSLAAYGFLGRRSPCEALTRIGEFLGPLRRIALVDSRRYGRFTGEELERLARGESGGDEDGAFDPAALRAALAEAPPGTLAAKAALLESIRDSLDRADAVLSANAEGATAPRFAATFEVLDSILEALSPYRVIESEAESDDSADEVVAISGHSSSTTGPSGKVITTRDDVVRTLDFIVEYYRLSEPASPVPILLKRARSWVQMDFISILKDISPDSIESFEQVLLARSAESHMDDS